MYKKFSIALVALALCACTALSAATTAVGVLSGGPTPGAIQQVGNTVVLDGTKALVVAHLTYNTVGDAAVSARKNHLINDATWAQVKQYDTVIFGYLSAGDRAQTQAEKAANASSALQAIDALKALVPASLFK